MNTKLMMFASIILIVLVVMFSGCNGSNNTVDTVGPQVQFSAIPTSVDMNEIQFEMKAVNTTDKPMELVFSSGKIFDIWITIEGKEVFRESIGKTYTQEITKFSLKPGEVKVFKSSWIVPDNLKENADKFVVYGQLLTSNYKIAPIKLAYK